MRKVLVGGKRQGGEVPERAEIARKIPIKAAAFSFARQKAVQLCELDRFHVPAGQGFQLFLFGNIIVDAAAVHGRDPSLLPG